MTSDTRREAHPAAAPSGSLTCDRGKEMAEPRLVTEMRGLHVDFAPPQSPWERGLNENMNGLRGRASQGHRLHPGLVAQHQARAGPHNSRPHLVLNWRMLSEMSHDHLVALKT